MVLQIFQYVIWLFFIHLNPTLLNLMQEEMFRKMIKLHMMIPESLISLYLLHYLKPE